MLQLGLAGALGNLSSYTSGVTVSTGAALDLDGITPTANGNSVPLYLNGQAEQHGRGLDQQQHRRQRPTAGRSRCNPPAASAAAGNITLTGAIGGAYGLTKVGAGTLVLRRERRYELTRSTAARSKRAASTPALGTAVTLTRPRRAQPPAAARRSPPLRRRHWAPAASSLPAATLPDRHEQLRTARSTWPAAASWPSTGTGTSTFSGAISGSGSLSQSGGGTLTLSGSNNYTGTTTANNGLLVINNSSALPTGSALGIGSGGSVVLGDPLLGGSAIVETSGSQRAPPGRERCPRGAGAGDAGAPGRRSRLRLRTKAEGGRRKAEEQTQRTMLIE